MSTPGDGSGRRHRLLAAGAWAVLLAGVVTWALVADVSPAEAATRLVDAIQGSAWGPVAFVAVYLVRPLIFFSAAVLTVAGGFLFGAAAGIVLVVLASNGSALVAYGLARWFGAGGPGTPTAPAASPAGPAGCATAASRRSS